MFTLVVDDFLIIYHDKAALTHLQATLREEYQFNLDDAATKYIGITLAYDRPHRIIALCMPGYVAAYFRVVPGLTPTHNPPSFTPIQYGLKI